MLVNPFYYECVSNVSSSIDIIQMNCIIFEGYITTLKRNYCSIFSVLGEENWLYRIVISGIIQVGVEMKVNVK